MDIKERQKLRDQLSNANKELMEAVEKWVNNPTPENENNMKEKYKIQEPINKEFWKEIFNS